MPSNPLIIIYTNIYREFCLNYERAPPTTQLTLHIADSFNSRRAENNSI